VEAQRPRVLEAGLFLLVVALPLAFFPLSRGAFLDVKLLVLTAGTLLLWLSGLPVDRRVAVPAFVWAGVVVVAALAGVDPVESLVGTVRGSGLVLLLCAATIVAIAPSLPAPLLERARGWLLTCGMAISVVAVTARVAPEILEPLARRVSFVGSTLGNPVRVSGFLAACIPAILAVRGRRAWREALLFGVLGAGLAAAEERSAYLLPVVALVAAAWFVRPGWRRVALAGGCIAVVLGLWAFAPRGIVSDGPIERYTAVGQFQTLTGERQRIALYGANARAVAERPILGWGPANAWSGYLSSGTASQIEQAGRNWADAHNLVLELAVVSGVAGLAAFGWLLVRLVPRAVRSSRSSAGRGWLLAAATTLAVYALVEPLDVVLTPLLFLLGGAAAGLETAAAEAGARRRPPIRIGVAVVVAGVCGITAVNLGASALEEWGHTHYGSDWALRAATDLAPWRLTASEALATNLAVEGRAGDEVAEREARDVVDRLVGNHPMNPGVRLLAADVELLLQNLPGTQEWIRRHLTVFPNDTVTVPIEEPGITLPT
jgi:O-antigen ligase